MPVAEYDSVNPAATSEKIAPVTPPLTTRVRNLVTLGRVLPAVAAGHGGGERNKRSAVPPHRVAPPTLTPASAGHWQARVALERRHHVVVGAADLHDRRAVGREVVRGRVQQRPGPTLDARVRREAAPVDLLVPRLGVQLLADGLELLDEQLALDVAHFTAQRHERLLADRLQVGLDLL